MLCSGDQYVRNYGYQPASIASYYRSVEQTHGQNETCFFSLNRQELQKAETITA